MSDIIKTERNYGIDLIKTLSMLMVVLLHVLGRGGVLSGAELSSYKYYIVWFLEIAAYCAVNCFALATGYLMVGRNVKYRKIVNLWLVVEFYSLLFYFIDKYAFKSEITPAKEDTLLPVSSNQFWYFTAYFCLFFFIPFINKLIDSLSKKGLYAFLITGFFLFCVGYSILGYDIFGLGGGYSVWWLMYLYFLGAAIKKYNLFHKIPSALAFVMYFLTVIVLLIFKAIETLDKISPPEKPRYHTFFWSRFLSYNSPLVLICAVCLLLFCLKLRIPKFIGKGLGYIQPLIFQVYIIHMHNVAWEEFIFNDFSKYLEKDYLPMVLCILGVALEIFFVCLLVDWIRSLLFKFLRIEGAVNFISDRIVRIFSKISDKNA